MADPLIVYIVIALGAFLTGLSKGGLGGVLGSLVTPLLALVMPAPVAVGLTLPLLLSGDICALYAHWRGWDRRVIVAVLPASIVGVIIGSLVIGSLSPITLQRALGLAALLYTVYKLWQRRSRRQPSSNLPRWQSSAFGVTTGFASTVANAGGPIFTIYLLGLRLTPSIFVGTSALYYALLNTMKLPAYLSAHILTPETILVVAWSMPLVPFGVWIGVILDRYIDMPTFEIIIIIFLAITGVVLLFK